MEQELSHTQIVRRLIEDALKTRTAVSKYYIIERIKNVIHPIELFNKVLTNGANRSDSATDSGVENIHRGADKVFRDSIRSLKRVYACGSDGMIVPAATLYEFQGRTMTLKEWADFLGIQYGTLTNRLNEGWSLERALTKPVYNPHSPHQRLLGVITHDWTLRSLLFEKFAALVPPDEAREVWRVRLETVQRYDLKRGRSGAKAEAEAENDATFVYKGRNLLFADSVSYLKNHGDIEMRGTHHRLNNTSQEIRRSEKPMPAEQESQISAGTPNSGVSKNETEDVKSPLAAEEGVSKERGVI